MNSVTTKCTKMELQYENWSKVLIEPQSLNDAKLFNIEHRVEMEQDNRIREFKIVQE